MVKSKTLWGGLKTGFRLFMTTVVVTGMVACATSVPIKSVQKPTIDTQGINNLAIKEFENVSGVGGAVGTQLPTYLTARSTQLITGTGKFTMVHSSDKNADGVFTGQITSIASKDSQEQSTYTDNDGNTRTQTTYKREVSVEFSYSVISSRTNMPIGTVYKKGSTSASKSSSSELPDVITLAKQIVDAKLEPKQGFSLFGGDSQENGLVKDIVPYIVSTNKKLEKETLKDKVAKEKMKAALKLVKDGHYEEAIALYDEISSEHNSVAAKINAGIIREVIASDTASKEELAKLFEDKGGLADKAIKSALDSLNANIPSGANITIMKTSSTERQRIDYIVDQITKTVVQEKKLAIVDRSNQALINAEQQFQMSGSVSDDSAVSIGNQLGVKYIVLCWISGEQSLRRFYLKVLDVETAQIADQADFEI